MATDPLSFEPLWKIYMNNVPLPKTAPIIGAPKRASQSLVRQATRALLKGQNRKSVLRQLATSTKRSPATVVAPPIPPAPGFGGAGYSGNNAAQLGHPSNPGFTS